MLAWHPRPTLHRLPSSAFSSRFCGGSRTTRSFCPWLPSLGRVHLRRLGGSHSFPRVWATPPHLWFPGQLWKPEVGCLETVGQASPALDFQGHPAHPSRRCPGPHPQAPQGRGQLLVPLSPRDRHRDGPGSSGVSHFQEATAESPLSAGGGGQEGTVPSRVRPSDGRRSWPRARGWQGCAREDSRKSQALGRGCHPLCQSPRGTGGRGAGGHHRKLRQLQARALRCPSRTPAAAGTQVSLKRSTQGRTRSAFMSAQAPRPQSRAVGTAPSGLKPTKSQGLRALHTDTCLPPGACRGPCRDEDLGTRPRPPATAAGPHDRPAACATNHACSEERTGPGRGEGPGQRTSPATCSVPADGVSVSSEHYRARSVYTNQPPKMWKWGFSPCVSQKTDKMQKARREPRTFLGSPRPGLTPLRGHVPGTPQLRLSSQLLPGAGASRGGCSLGRAHTLSPPLLCTCMCTHAHVCAYIAVHVYASA